MWNIVIPLSMTVSSCDFDTEKKSLTYSLDILFIKIYVSERKIIKKNGMTGYFSKNFNLSQISMSKGVIKNQKKGLIHAIFFLSCLLQHHDHYHTEAVKPHGPKLRSAMQISNSKRLCPFSSEWALGFKRKLLTAGEFTSSLLLVE